ncbi:hypothetical protein J3E68DRAFT_430095 [Trichoderma sp. SZMC 28012]
MLMHLLRQVMFWEFYALLATYPGKGTARMPSTYPRIFGRQFMTWDAKQADPRPAPPPPAAAARLPPAGELPEPKMKEEALHFIKLYKERVARHHAQIAKFTKYRDSDHDAAAIRQPHYSGLFTS